MARAVIGAIVVLALSADAGKPITLAHHRRHVTALTAQHSTIKAAVRSSATAAKASFHKKVQNLKHKNPSFSEAACTEMFATKMRLGGSVPPSDQVVGCTVVCDSVKKLKDYWGSGEMGSFACSQGHAYGCVYDGTPPVAMSAIGC